MSDVMGTEVTNRRADDAWRQQQDARRIEEDRQPTSHGDAKDSLRSGLRTAFSNGSSLRAITSPPTQLAVAVTYPVGYAIGASTLK
jgi:hypothetical protein